MTLWRIKTKERILKALREKNQVILKGKPISITSDLSEEMVKAKSVQDDVLLAPRVNNCKTRILDLAMLFIIS